MPVPRDTSLVGQTECSACRDGDSCNPNILPSSACARVCGCATPLRRVRPSLMLILFNPPTITQARPDHFPARKRQNSERATRWPGSHSRLGQNRDSSSLALTATCLVAFFALPLPILPPGHQENWLGDLKAKAGYPMGRLQLPTVAAAGEGAGQVWKKKAVSLFCSVLTVAPGAHLEVWPPVSQTQRVWQRQFWACSRLETPRSLQLWELGWGLIPVE